MLNYSCDTACPILNRPLGDGQFFDIIRLPGGRFKTMVVFLDSFPTIRSLPPRPIPGQMTKTYGELR